MRLLRSTPAGALVAAALVALALPAAAGAATPRIASSSSCAHADVLAVDEQTRRLAIGALRCLVDEVRVAAGLPPLRRSAQLERAAQRHVDDEARHVYLSHVNRRGQDLQARVIAARYPRRRRSFRSSETLSWGIGIDGTAIGLLDVLRNSAAHNRRVMRADFRELGVGLAVGLPVRRVGPGTTLSLIFGRR